MKTSITFSMLFWLKLSNAKNGKAPMYARITVNGKRVEISLNRKVEVSQWSPTKNRIKGTRQEARILNNYLDQVHREIHTAKNELKSDGKLVTAQAIKARYLGEDAQNYTIKDIIKYHNTDMIGKLKKGTQKNYFTTQNYILAFLIKEYKTTNIYLKQLDYNFIIKFEKFLRNTTFSKSQMGNNTVMKHIERLRKLITMAFKLEWLSRDPFINFKASFVKTERGFLSDEELFRIETQHFSIKRLQLARDLFVFSCYTSLSYIDVINLTSDNINIGIDGQLWITQRREKTNKPLRIPLLPKALALIEKYKTNTAAIVNGTIFPKISNQKLNVYLKEVASICGIHKNITFHVARHTFATTVTLSNGVPIETISKVLGHSRIATTQIYAKVIERKVSEDMKALQIKMTAIEKVKCMK